MVHPAASRPRRVGAGPWPPRRGLAVRRRIALELARKTYSRKHEARRLQGEILAATGRMHEALPLIQASIGLAQELQTRRDIWMGSLALGQLLLKLARDKEAEVAFNAAAATIESIAAALKTESLRRSFLAAPPVLEAFKVLGRRPPIIEPPSPDLLVESLS